MHRFIFFLIILIDLSPLFCQNQTNTISPIYPSDSLPFQVSVETYFSLPQGLHSYVFGVHEGKWLLLAGRTNGLHGFDNNVNNFPPNKQNTTVFVIDPETQEVWSKSLLDASSGLTQNQVDTLSVVSAQSYFVRNTLYVTGGYGVDTATGQMGTKAVLTAIDIPGLIHWVVNPHKEETAAQHIRQISHPWVQVTGGYMAQVNDHLLTLLIFGQNFDGLYTVNSNGNYTQQVRPFRIIDNGKDLYIETAKAEAPNPNYRRRDLNVVPTISKDSKGRYHESFVAFSGVFTIPGGAWTVPVIIRPNGSTFMANPNDPSTFKQGMNNYTCPTIGLFSKKTRDMYVVILGGITFGFFQGGVFSTDDELPFTNQITTVKIDPQGSFTQFIMKNEYPLILSTFSNPGNQLLFGAGGQFFPVEGLPTYSNGVFRLEKLEKAKSPVLLGYIVGGIQSTLPNTNDRADSAASPYVFKVILTPQ